MDKSGPGRRKLAQPRTRYTLDLPCTLDARVTQLAEEQGVTKADVLRAALLLLSEHEKLRREGYNTGGWRTSDDGTRETVRLPVLL